MTNWAPPWPPTFDLLRAEDILNEARANSHEQAYKFCIYLQNLEKTKRITHKIATAESLTGGLIFSTLVDIPLFGSYKYGCFSVYDTDAKRVMLGVKVKDVYTHRCAKEMAEGILLNSNATIGIAVTGNAMPYTGEENRLGEVFIGIATYLNDKKIISKTHAVNMCQISKAYNLCKLWNTTIKDEIRLKNYLGESNSKQFMRFTDGNNDSILTAFISNFIRAKTTEIAFTYALAFMKQVVENKKGGIIPSWIKSSRIEKMDGWTSLYDEKNFTSNSCLNSSLLEFRKDIIKICENETTCREDKRRITAEFKGGKKRKYTKRTQKKLNTKIT